ncbi:hypothetical protein ABT090_21180 [Streptomyces asoensis]
MPDPNQGPPPGRPVVRRVDVSAADTENLVEMGVMPEQPEPPPADEAE